MDIKFAIRPGFLPLWESKARYIIVMGGRGAGRSTAVSQYLVSRIPASEYLRAALMRAVHHDIRHSCWREINDRINEQDEDIRGAMRITDNNMQVSYGDNSLHAHGFRASSTSHSAKLKSIASYNTVWIEEAEEIGEQEFMTLDDSLRTVKGDIKIILTLNPPPKTHWIIQRWFDLLPCDVPDFYIPKLKAGIDDVEFIFGTFEDNLPNLDEHTTRRYRAYKETKPSYYNQMIRGLVPETVRGKIFSGWKQIDEVPHEARLVAYGLDFGWFPDPAALVAVYEYNGGYIIDELAYGTEKKNQLIAEVILSQTKKAITVADSAEPKSIAEIRSYGVDIVGADKGADSVVFGIKVVSGLQISVTKSSKNVWKCYENWAWAEDKDGNPKGFPDNTWKHAMDAIIYPLVSINKIYHKEPEDISHLYDDSAQFPDIGV